MTLPTLWFMDYLATAKDPNVYPNVKVPVMVIYPEQDMFLWPTQAIDTPSRVDAECRIEFIQGGHWSMLDHPDDVNVADAGLVRLRKLQRASKCQRSMNSDP